MLALQWPRAHDSRKHERAAPLARGARRRSDAGGCPIERPLLRPQHLVGLELELLTGGGRPLADIVFGRGAAGAAPSLPNGGGGRAARGAACGGPESDGRDPDRTDAAVAVPVVHALVGQHCLTGAVSDKRRWDAASLGDLVDLVGLQGGQGGQLEGPRGPQMKGRLALGAG